MLSFIRARRSESWVALGLLCAACGSEGAAVEAQSSASTATESYFQTQFGIALGDVVWGDMHTHTLFSQDAALQGLLPGSSTSNPATVYAEARARGFSFSATSDHAEAPVPAQIPNGAPNVWESTRWMASAAEDVVDDADGIFLPFMGYEYTNPFPCVDMNPGDGINECNGGCTSLGGNESCTAHGHKNVVFRSISGAPYARYSFLDPTSWTASGRDCRGNRPDSYCGFDTYTEYAADNLELWAKLDAAGLGGAPADVLTIIHTPGNIHHNDWGVTDDAFVRHVEIFSQWGNSEGPAPAQCGRSQDISAELPQGALNQTSELIRPQLARRWLLLGDEAYVLGFVGGSDDHAGRPGGEGTGNGAITGVIPVARTRDGVFDGMWHRHTMAATYYSATGPAPMLVGMTAGSAELLGGDLGTMPASGDLTLHVLADPSVEDIEVVVDGCTVQTFSGSSAEVSLSLPSDERHYVYVRARRQMTAADAQTDYDVTWSSPIYLRAR